MRTGEMRFQEMFPRENLGLSPTFVFSGKKQKLRLPAFLFLPTPVSNWDCEKSQTHMCEQPSLHICITSTLPFLNQPRLGYPRPRTTQAGSFVCFQEDHLRKGLTQGLEAGLRQAFVQGIWRSQGRGGKCKKRWVLVLDGHVSLGQLAIFFFGKDVAGGSLGGDPGQDLQWLVVWWAKQGIQEEE